MIPCDGYRVPRKPHMGDAHVVLIARRYGLPRGAHNAGSRTGRSTSRGCEYRAPDLGCPRAGW